MAVSTTCLRYLVFVVVVLYGLSGLAVAVCGGLLVGQLFATRDVLRPPVLQICWVLAGMGLAASVFSILGWRAVAKKSTALIRTFAALVVVVIVVQLSVATWALVERTRVHEGVIPALESRLRAYDASLPKTAHFWDRIQTTLECCGVDGPADWRSLAAAVPWSCCANAQTSSDAACASIHQRGCPTPLGELASMRLAAAAGIAATASLAQAIAALLAALLASALLRKKRRDAQVTASMLEAVPLRTAKK